MDTTKELTAIILGNGFEIAYGYKTRYNDFIDSDQFNDLKFQGNNLAKHIYEVKNIQNWVDVEVEIGKYSYRMSQILPINEFIKQTEVFKREFEDLRDALSKYISQQTYTRVSHQKMDNLVAEWIRPALLNRQLKFFVTTFNYSRNDQSIILNRYKPYLHDSLINFIHGIAELYSEQPCDIVLGIDENCKHAPEHSFIVKAFNSHTNASQFFENIGLAQKYIIFGCSMGETDYRYFYEILSQKNKQYILYGFGVDGLIDIRRRIAIITGNYTKFIKENDVRFIDSKQYSNN